MRALFKRNTQHRKIVISLVFAFALIGVASFAQNFTESSQVFGATELNDGKGGGVSGDTSGGGSDSGALPSSEDDGGGTTGGLIEGGGIINDGKGGGFSDTKDDGTSGDFGGGDPNSIGGGGNSGNNNNGGNGSGGGNGTGTGELCGFAWGSTSEPVVPKMGVGWVSFNSKDCDTNGDGTINGSDTNTSGACPAGGTGSYSVSVDSDGDLVGYAWSNNLGWLKFGGLSGFPNTAGNNQQDARIAGNGDVSGWARFCAGTVGGNCSSMTSRNDGWDGWVSLRGAGGAAYGVSVVSEIFSGYSWGGDVVGALNWNAGTGNNVRFCVQTPKSLNVDLSASPSSGNNPLNNVDLTATLSGTATGNSTIKFDCTNNGSYDVTVNNVAGNSYTAVDACDYPSAGEYTAKVEVTRDGLVVSDTTIISVTNSGGPGPGPTGNLEVSCSVTRPAFVNLPVTWTVVIDSQSVGPYDYSFVFSDGVGNAIYTDSNDTVKTVVNTYTSPGPRTLTATVTDNASTPTVVNCSQNANVIVKPNIIPI